jgi:hypothetical protein
MKEDVFARRLITWSSDRLPKPVGRKGGVNHVRIEPKDVSKLSSLFRRSSRHRVSLARSEIELFACEEINE